MTASEPSLLLLGSGRSHLLLLLRARTLLGASPQLTLVAPDRFALYPALLPELVSGQLSYRECHIDLQLLCEQANARLINSPLESLDLNQRRAHLSNGEQIRFDLVSLAGDIESSANVSNNSIVGLSTSPVNQFLPHWQGVLEDVYKHPKGAKLALVGEDESSVELALAIRKRLTSDPRPKNPPELHLVHEGRSLLPQSPLAAQLQAAQALQEQQIRVHPLFPAVRLEEGQLVSERGQRLPVDAVIWCQTESAARRMQWPELARGEQGLIKVNRHLQSVSHPFVFASGAWAELDSPSHTNRASSAYQAPVLSANLGRYLRGEPLKAYKEPRNPLNFIKLGPEQVMALHGNRLLSGRWVKRWKTFIDRRFMARFPRP